MKSIVLDIEYIRAAIEYKSNKILITFDPNQIILIENWQEIRRITNGSENNIN